MGKAFQMVGMARGEALRQQRVWPVREGGDTHACRDQQGVQADELEKWAVAASFKLSKFTAKRQDMIGGIPVSH